jgi:hypothetical protein
MLWKITFLLGFLLPGVAACSANPDCQTPDSDEPSCDGCGTATNTVSFRSAFTFAMAPCPTPTPTFTTSYTSRAPTPASVVTPRNTGRASTTAFTAPRSALTAYTSAGFPIRPPLMAQQFPYATQAPPFALGPLITAQSAFAQSPFSTQSSLFPPSVPCTSSPSYRSSRTPFGPPSTAQSTPSFAFGPLGTAQSTPSFTFGPIGSLSTAQSTPSFAFGPLATAQSPFTTRSSLFAPSAPCATSQLYPSSQTPVGPLIAAQSAFATQSSLCTPSGPGRRSVTSTPNQLNQRKFRGRGRSWDPEHDKQCDLEGMEREMATLRAGGLSVRRQWHTNAKGLRWCSMYCKAPECDIVVRIREASAGLYAIRSCGSHHAQAHLARSLFSANHVAA